MLSPSGVLMCPPDHFDVVDEKNPHMAGHAGHVDRALARAQWGKLRALLSGLGLRVELVEALPDCEDMVFAANQAFSGPGRICVLSHMRHASRQLEVPAFRRWFKDHGYRLIESPCLFEGGGDALWHPRGDCILFGHGFRSEPAAAEVLADAFGVEIEVLRLVNDRFYHLDTCLCPLDEQTALAYLPAFEDPSRVRKRFETVLEVDEEEAFVACNAAAYGGADVVIDRRAARTIDRLKDRYGVQVVDTGEFVKSGGSVYCLKHNLFDNRADAGA